MFLESLWKEPHCKKIFKSTKICCLFFKYCFYFVLEFRFLGNWLFIMTTTLNFISILQSISVIAFLHGYFLQCIIWNNTLLFQEWSILIGSIIFKISGNPVNRVPFRARESDQNDSRFRSIVILVQLRSNLPSAILYIL